MEQLLDVDTSHLPGFYDESYGDTPEDEIRALKRQTLSGAPYHKPSVGWEGEYLGFTWRDMRGCTSDDKKMNFSLFRRGLITVEDMENPLDAWSFRRHGQGMAAGVAKHVHNLPLKGVGKRVNMGRHKNRGGGKTDSQEKRGVSFSRVDINRGGGKS